jgi:hypothetical protein
VEDEVGGPEELLVEVEEEEDGGPNELLDEEDMGIVRYRISGKPKGESQSI